MCGIGGVVFRNKAVERSRLSKMASFSNERGPDNTGLWIDANMGFYHNRLSIIDLSQSANQPMVKENHVIVFNGEIYNFKQLKKEIENLGSSFKTNSDTEVILEGYKVWGIDKLVSKLDGMFAFSILDRAKQSMVLVRDRFGKKPLYYLKNNLKFTFSSDIRAIKWEEPNLTVNYNSIDYFLSELTVPQPNSIWNEVKQVEAGFYMTYNFSTNEIEHKKYHSFQFADEKLTFNNEESLLDELESKLTKAITKRTLADVPIGCFLSGGVDSGLIVALLAENSSKPVKTYTVGFENKDYNEISEAKLVYEKYATQHTELMMPKSDIGNLLIDLTKYIGEPFADPSIIPTYLISKEISNHVKVALSGDGGDEVFGGYGEYLTAYQSEVFSKSNSPNVQKIKALYSKFNNRVLKKSDRSSLFYSFSNQLPSQKLNRNIGFSDSEKIKLYKAKHLKPFYSELYLNELWDENSNNISSTDDFILTSLRTRLLNDYLVKVDRMSMRSSLEVRSPFLDTELADFSFSLDHKYRFNGGLYKKYLLKKIVSKKYDERIFNRPKKGFSIPLKQILKNELKEMSYDLLTSQIFKNRNLFNASFVDKLISNHMNGIKDNSNKIWILMCLEIWFQNNI